MARPLYAALLADVIGSGKRKQLPSLLDKLLHEASQAHRKRKLILLSYAVTAGDEFETITKNLENIPWLLLDLRSRMQPLSLRIGVGIGEVDGQVRAPVNKMDGQAFHMARQALDGLKRAKKGAALTGFCSVNHDFDEMANLIYSLHDTLVRKVTEKQWKTVAARLEHGGLYDTARALGLDSSTVSRNLKRGYYGQLVSAAAGVEQLVAERFAIAR